MAETKAKAETKAQKEAAARRESSPTKRVVLMEFDVSGAKLLEAMTEEQQKSLMTQLGVETPDALDRPVTILTPVAHAAGGPKAVIEAEAKTRGRFRAISDDSFAQGHEAIPPEKEQYDLKPL